MKRAVALLLLTAAGFAQDGSPLRIRSLSVSDRDADQRVSFRVKNAGSRPILAYVSYVEVKDGARIMEVYKRQHIAFDRSAVYQPDAEWSEEYSLALPRGAAGPALVVAQPRIDFVLFEDGTQWGPDQYRLASRIRGEIAGVTFEHARLRDLLKRKGIEALVTDLSGNRFDR